MSGYRVIAPVETFTGDACGVAFVKGVAEPVSEGSALAYFRQAGYVVEPVSESASPEPVAPDAGVPGPVGPLDATVGKYDPHGEGQRAEDVLAYLGREDVDLAEATRVLDAEAAGVKPRKGITDRRAELLAAKTTGGTS